MEKYHQGRQREQREFDQRIAQVSRVTRVTSGGRRFTFRVLVIVGNKKGKVGIATGKAKDISQAINKASRQAERRVIMVPLQDGTIPFEITAKFKMTNVLLKPASKGRGIIAGGVVRDICELAGIDNINAKILSSSKSKINNAKAVLNAFGKITKILEVKRALRGERQPKKSKTEDSKEVKKTTSGKKEKTSEKK